MAESCWGVCFRFATYALQVGFCEGRPNANERIGIHKEPPLKSASFAILIVSCLLNHEACLFSFA